MTAPFVTAMYAVGMKMRFTMAKDYMRAEISARTVRYVDHLVATCMYRSACES